MSPHDIFMNRVWRICFFFTLIFVASSAFILALLYWPYPTVTYVPGATLTNEPADGTYQTGDIVRWTTTEVCQPGGETSVVITAKLIVPQGSSETPIVERKFNIMLEEPTCLRDNPTSLWLPGSLPSGYYETYVYACVPNRSPRDRCATVPGPAFQLERIPLAPGATQ